MTIKISINKPLCESLFVIVIRSMLQNFSNSVSDIFFSDISDSDTDSRNIYIGD